MDKELFDQLHQSMNEAVAIAKDEMQTFRHFVVESQDVKKTGGTPWREVAGKRGSIPASVLRGARSKAEITQTRLSELTGISQRHISEMEQGKRPIGKETAKKLAAALDVDCGVFL